MCGAGSLRELAEITQRVGPSMESNIYGVHKENKKKVLVVGGAGILREVDEIAFKRKIKDFRRARCWDCARAR